MKRIFAAVLACLLLSGCASRTDQQPEAQVSSIPKFSQDDVIPDPLEEEIASASDIQNITQTQEESHPFEQTTSTRIQTAGRQNVNSQQTTEDWMLLLANADHPIGDYTPELAVVSEPYQMDVRVAPVMKQMIADARQENIELMICSAYRPYSSQERNFNNSVNAYVQQGYSQEDAVMMTANMIARPGHSEHQTGLAADIVTPSYQSLDDGYAQTDAAKWLLENAAEYGFILRYPKDKTTITHIGFEPWHYRYVGVEAAKKIMEQGLCLEEYLDRLSDEQ